ncbi:MAG TPA: hypothetical protein VFS43_46730 [Polyangiaceae bacterium]|nr:hypothetical protein [Polyangiaceae bacterium]
MSYDSLLPELEAAELRSYFAGGGSELGLRSSLGAQLERAEARKPPKGGPRGSRAVTLHPARSPSYPDLADRMGEAAVDWLRVDKRLKAAGPRARRVLEALHGPEATLEPILPLYGALGRVMLLTKASGDATAGVLRQADEEGRKARLYKRDADAHGGCLESARWLAEVRTEARELATWAEMAYAATRPPKGQGEGGPDEREAERRAHYAGRVDEHRRVVFSTPSAKRAAGGGR